LRLFLGVDGGQSGAVALIGNEEGRVVGVGRGVSVQAALGNAQVADTVFESVCFGLSGGAEGRDALVRGLVKSARYRIEHDAWVALAGATAGEPGIVVIAGTGSMAFGRNRENRTARAGGWGYVFGDEGGAFDLVRQALRAVLRAEEGWGPQTLLRELLLESTGAGDANSLMHLFYTNEYPRQRVAALAPLLDRAAGLRDAVAQDILKHAAQSLATFAAAVRRQLFDPAETVTVSYTGGVFGCQVLLERFRILVELDEGNRVARPRYGPAAGALLEAYRAAGLECTLSDIPEEKGAAS
jgi:N-acetylglucosamine kinase-like BadF-type ATPase